MKDMLNKIILGDCLDVMKDMPDKCVDLVLTDPPYGIGEDIRKKDNSGRLNWESNERWDLTIPSKEYFDEMIRISKNQIIWGGNYFIDYLSNTRCYLIWDKIQDFSGADSELAWTSFQKSAKTFRMSRIEFHAKENKIHPTQKPLALMSWCLERFSKPNDIIFDPFIGSGTTAIACIANNRQFIGIEKDPEYHRLACERVEKEKLNLFDCN
jgi:site-specific DNA-methyltransferase (adenine-specific)